MKRLIVIVICLLLVFQPVFTLTVPSQTPVKIHYTEVYSGGAPDSYSDDYEYAEGGLDPDAMFVFGVCLFIAGTATLATIPSIRQSEEVDDSGEDIYSVGLGSAGIALMAFGIWMMAEGNPEACFEVGCEAGCHLGAHLLLEGCMSQ